ncbi:threonine-phosphate decarboxylase [Sphingobium aromaticiconvertens]|uniref:threonine-phosphate decarboxylase n=1 Tax=Sphingobium aromaticiconvertens TaxID=365341 RepID=UPI003019AC3E
MNGWTFHGGRLSKAKAHFGNVGAQWLDLSTGINPHAWPGVSNLSIDWRSLPDVKALEALEAAAAHHFGVDPAHICAVPGTEVGLRMLGDCLPGPAAHVVPSYRTHGEMVMGSRPIAITDVVTIAGSTLILANPNNPDGRVLTASELAGTLQHISATAGWLVIDEAFADATPDISLASQISDDRPLVIFRSFGKFFGLAGVRLGFVLGPRTLIARFRAKLGSWPLSSAAIAIGAAAYRDERWIEDMRTRLPIDAKALSDMLLRHSLKVIGECPLFGLIEVDDAATVFERLARRAILTRPFDHNPSWLRIGLPDSEEALARLDDALTYG